MVKKDVQEEPAIQKKLEWKNCDEELPTECKQYAVRVTNGGFSVDLRTPCLMEKKDPSYRWRCLPCSHWCELPAPFYRYGKGPEGWHDYMYPYGSETIISDDKPVFSGEHKTFFVTTLAGYSSVRIFRNDTQTFDGDTGDLQNHVIAWMEMPEL